MIRSNTDSSTQKNVLRQVNEVQLSKQARDRRFSWLVGAAVLATMMLVAMIVESQLNLFSHAFRFGLTILSLAVAVICTWKLWNRGQRANSRMVSAAKDIDATYPAMQERISTLTSCNEDRLESQQLVHPAMLNRLTEETATLQESVEPKSVVSYRMLRLPLVWLSVAALVLLSLFAWDAPKTLVQLGRFFAPWANLSTTQVTAVDSDQVVARNEPYKLTASMSGRIVDEVEFLSKNVDGTDSSKTRLWPSAKDDTVASVRQSKATDSFDYQFRAGDGQTNWHRVTVADRPKIEDLKVRIVPPEYTGKSAKTYQRLPKKLRVVVGSRLEVEVKPKNKVRTARLVMGKTDWLPMAQAAGGIYDCSFDLWQPVDFKVQLTELHGLINRRPPGCRLQVVADQAPKVKILKPTKTTVLLPDEAIDIHFKASDDFGIQKMALRVSTQRESEDQPTVHEVPIPMKENTNRRKIKGVVQLDLAQFNLKDGDTISYEIRVSDNFRQLDKELEPNEIQSMKDVEMVQAKPSAEATKGVATKTSPGSKQSPGPQDPTTNQGNLASSQTATGGNQQVAASSPSPSQAASNSAASSSANSAAVPPSQKDSVASQAVDQASTAPLDGQDSSQPASNKVADDPASDSAANQNEIQSASAEPKPDSGAKDSRSNAIAKSDPSVKSASSANASPSSSSNANPSSPSNASSQSSQSQQSASSQKNSNSSSKSDQKVAANEAPQSDSAKTDSDSTQPESDPVNMTTRSLDVGGGQSSSSGQRQVKVDKYAGGFTSEDRNKLEIAISPTLELFKKSLISAGNGVKEVMSDSATGPAAKIPLSSAAGDLKTASEAVLSLKDTTRNTPYAFVGLRLESIRAADVAPAIEEVRKAIDAQAEPRLQHARTAWNHISRALAMLAKLDEQYQLTRRSLKRADDILEFKKMHRIFIEKSMTMLNPRNSVLNGQSRKGVEFDLDEEYLKRLKEVLQLREEMMAELARILDDDPQLLRRYMNSMNKRTWSIRDQLTLIANDQKGLSQRISSWSNATAKPLDLVNHQRDATELHLSEIEGLASRLADVRNEFVSWLPLEDDIEKREFADVIASFQATGSSMTEIVADVEAILLGGGVKADPTRQIAPLISKATETEKLLANTVQSLRQLNRESTEAEVVNNAARRVPDLEKVQRDMLRWTGKLELFDEGLVHEVYSVDQESRRDQLLQYSVKIASLQSQLVAALQNQDGELPDSVAEQTQKLQSLLDVEIPAAQLIAAQTLTDADQKSALVQQASIVQDFEIAEDLFDEILQAIADELDKVPPADPIASLLRDPTLDEILAQLENELDFLEELGISGRPSNLQIMGGWSSRSGGMNGGMMRRLSNMAYRNAVRRARVKKRSNKPKLAKDNERWNQLVGKLGEGMLQGDNKIPPERYRAAIEHYSEQISKLKNEQDIK